MSEPQPIPTGRPPLHVHDVPDRSRYEARLGDDPALAGLLTYRLGADWMALLHTEVQEGYEGRGVGSRLVRAVLEDLRARGLRLVPKCPFVVRWLERHPEQQDILLRPLGAPDPGEPGTA
jgi:predicted GNAT family acetyltransferase